MAESREEPTKQGPDSYDLPALFESLRGYYPDLTNPPDSSLASLQEELRQVRSKELTVEYISVTSTALVFIVTFGLIATQGFRAAVAFQADTSRLLRLPEYLTSHPEIAAVALLAGTGAVLYSLVMHQLWADRLHVAFRQNQFTRYNQVRRTNWRFILYAMTVNYLAGWVTLLFLNSYTLDSAVARWFTIVWLYLPVLAAAIVPSFVVLFCLGSVTSKRRDRYREGSQAAVLRQLLLLLRQLKDVHSPSEVSSVLRQDLMSRVGSTARMLRTLSGRGGPRDGSSVWSEQRMNRAGDNFLTLASWIAFPKSDTYAEAKRRLVEYSNIVAEGRYDALPSDEVTAETGILAQGVQATQWQRVTGLAGLLLLLSSPLVLFAALVSFMHWELPAAVHTATAVAYSAWIVICLLSYMDKLAPEAKTMMLDLIRLVFGR